MREKAAAALVEALVANQAEFEAESGAEGSDEEEANGAVGGGGKAREVARALRRCSPLMIYAFKRLCRGLGSSRQGARQGFSLAIASLLGAVQCIGPAEAVTAIEGVLEPVGKVRAEGSWFGNGTTAGVLMPQARHVRLSVPHSPGAPFPNLTQLPPLPLPGAGFGAARCAAGPHLWVCGSRALRPPAACGTGQQPGSWAGGGCCEKVVPAGGHRWVLERGTPIYMLIAPPLFT